MSCDGVSAAFMLSCTGAIRFTLRSAVVAFWSSPGDLQRLELSDEAMGSTFSIVLYGYDRRQLPSEVTDALSRVGHRHVRLDAAARTIHFDRPGVELDPGGIGKGYAVDPVSLCLCGLFSL